MKLTRLLLAVAILAVSGLAAEASVTLNIGAGVLYEHDGVSVLPDNSTIVLLADTGSNGFDNLVPITSVWSAGDFVVARFASNENGDPGFTTAALSNLQNLIAGTPLELVWYDTPYSAGATGPGQKVYFGKYTASDWVVPSDGSLVSLNFITVSEGGSSLESAGIASLQTAPEPATMVLLAVGGVVGLLRRRRKA